jgi:hypothetical protein
VIPPVGVILSVAVHSKVTSLELVVPAGANVIIVSGGVVSAGDISGTSGGGDGGAGGAGGRLTGATRQLLMPGTSRASKSTNDITRLLVRFMDNLFLFSLWFRF